VLREGLYFFGHTGPLRLTRGYSHVSIVAFPGEVAILSGGVRLSPAWRPWKCPASVASAGLRGSQDRPGDGGQGQRGRAGGEKGGFGVCWKAQVKQYLPSVETQPDFVFNQLFVLLQPPPPPLPQQPAASPAPEPFESRRGEGKRGGGTGGRDRGEERERERDVASHAWPGAANPNGRGGERTGVTDGYSVRYIRARHPNGDPETSGLHTNPTGYMSSESAEWLPEVGTPPAREVLVQGLRNGSLFPNFQTGIGGPASVFDPPVSYWATASPPGFFGGEVLKNVCRRRV
jgi:hypothetical protein